LLFEINLLTGEHRQLGGKALEAGILHFPVISPDGRTLAAIKADWASGPLHSQVHLVDIASGTSKPLGKPLDTAFLSWLPDGEGLILVSRESPDPNQPSIGTICRMDLAGKLTPLRKGNAPLVLENTKRILFEDSETDEWKTCDFHGDDVRPFGDGMKDFGFPTPSPDGNRLIMMKFEVLKGPRPYIVEVSTGKSEPLLVGEGLWALPSWR
jgi:Tol biopolymer transport system component